jgi:Flp pilus assembly protein TadD
MRRIDNSPTPDREQTYNTDPAARQRSRLKLDRIAVLSLLFVAGACTTYSHTEKTSTQLAFGTAAAKKGLWREAAFRYEQAAAKDSNNARAHNNFAVSLEASGDFARALSEYKKALEISPNDNYIRRNYARFAEFYTAYTKTTGKAAGAP